MKINKVVYNEPAWSKTYTLDLVNGYLELRELDVYREITITKVNISAERIKYARITLERLGVGSFPKYYDFPKVLDKVKWSFTVYFADGQTAESRGINTWPDNFYVFLNIFREAGIPT